ncbi:hypothetical protein ACF0H5_005218 [Mactra antiquata]
MQTSRNKNMNRINDIDESIVQEAKVLSSLIQECGHKNVRVREVADVPLLLVSTFSLLTTERIEERSFQTPRQCAKILQKILDTLEQTMNLSLRHISGEGLVALDRRQLSDVIQIFIDIIKVCFPDAFNKTETPAGKRLTLSQLETTTSTSTLSTRTRQPSTTTSTSTLSATTRQPSTTTELRDILYNRTSTPDLSKIERQKKSTVTMVAPKLHQPGKITKPPAPLRRPSTRQGSNIEPKAKKQTQQKNKDSPVSVNRRPSVLSTKVKKIRTGSQSAPQQFSRNSLYRQPVKRGKISSRTNSLCSSIKLLEEFDYIERRLTEIKEQKNKVRELCMFCHQSSYDKNHRKSI